MRHRCLSFSTTIGAQGRDSVIGALSIADEPKEFASSVVQLLRDEALWRHSSTSELDTFGLVPKVVSTAPGYTSHRKDADDHSIIADAKMANLKAHRRELSASPATA